METHNTSLLKVKTKIIVVIGTIANQDNQLGKVHFAYMSPKYLQRTILVVWEGMCQRENKIQERNVREKKQEGKYDLIHIHLGSGWLPEEGMIWREGLVCCRGKCLKTMVLELQQQSNMYVYSFMLLITKI